MTPKFLIDDDLRQLIKNYIGAGSVSKAMTWAEVQMMLQRLENLETAEPSKPTLVEKK